MATLSPDLINGLFEFCGAAFICLSIRRTLMDKMVRGVSWLHVSFFSAWGFWNLYYYPHLDQWWSFAGGVAIVTANTVWVGLLIYYSWREYRFQQSDFKAIREGFDPAGFDWFKRKRRFWRIVRGSE